MALPAEITFFQMTGCLLKADPDGSDTLLTPDSYPDRVPLQGTLTFTPDLAKGARVAVTAAVPPVVVVVRSIPVTLAPDGSFSVWLVDSTNTDLNPYDWTWTVSFNLDGVNLPSQTFASPVAGVLDLADVVTVSPGSSVTLVTGPPGPPGDPGPAMTDAALAVAVVTGATLTALNTKIDNKIDTQHTADNATYAPKNSVYNFEQGSVYNLKPKHLLKTRAGLARAASGTGLFNLAFLGDSTIYGIGAVIGTSDYPTQMQKLLATAGYPAAGTLAVGVGAITADVSADLRITLGSGWGPFSDRSSYLQNGSTTTPLTFAFTEPSTQIRILSLDYWQAVWTITIDGGAPVTITDGTNPTVMKTWLSPVLTNGPHTVVINRVSTNTVFIHSVEAVTSTTTGTRILNAGFGGQNMTNFAYAEAGIAIIPTVVAGFVPDLTIFGEVVNDATLGTTVATYEAMMRSAITLLRVGSGDIILSTCVPRSTGAAVQPYIDVIYKLADELDLPVVDFHDRLNGTFQAEMMNDAAHPNAAGYADYARMMVAAILS